ncbi:copper resistance D family protein [Brachybacterium alimentarium]|uniref:copper resistance D family protein n=1 Tax=Brachybacterium alimentarium TaxID=47845 RepID=UPI000BB9396A|nr:CopD family protein [Brachybacterium alimentarium]PCC33004.1 copper-binding protein [Brachybacterium alimentarium]
MTSTPPTRPSPLVVGAVVAGLAVLSLLSVFAADAAGGDNLVLRDAGPLARLGSPIASMLADLAAALTLGGAVVAGWLLREDADRARALSVIGIAAAVTTLARGASLAFSYAVATGQPVGSERFGSDLSVFLATELGLWLVAALVIAATATTAAFTGTSRTTARVVAVAAGLVAFASAMTGHAAGDSSHEVATSTMLVHLLAVGIWLGGLGILQVLPTSSRDDVAVLRGYSHLALICWIALAVSGVWALAVRMNSIAEILTSAYVQLGVAKAVLLMALAGLGALQRRQLATGLGHDATGREAAGTYRRLALLELALMGLAVALAAAMSSSPPPADAGTPPAGPAGVLTSYPLPDAPSVATLLTSWRPDPFGMMLACVFVLLWWRPRGPERERGASVRLVLSGVVLVLLTSGALNVYSKVMVSAHLLQHLLLLAAAGALLGSAVAVPRVLGTLLGDRWWLAALLAAVPLALLAGVYASPLLRLALDSHALHLSLQMLALAGGVLITLVVRAVRGTGLRLLVLAVPVVLGLAAGVTLLLTDLLMAASWFGGTGRTWLPDALADQQRGGIGVLGVTVLAGGGAAAALWIRRPRRGTETGAGHGTAGDGQAERNERAGRGDRAGSGDRAGRGEQPRPTGRARQRERA